MFFIYVDVVTKGLMEKTSIIKPIYWKKSRHWKKYEYKTI